jgi:hypothetical protein
VLYTATHFDIEALLSLLKMRTAVFETQKKHATFAFFCEAKKKGSSGSRENFSSFLSLSLSLFLISLGNFISFFLRISHFSLSLSSVFAFHFPR